MASKLSIRINPLSIFASPQVIEPPEGEQHEYARIMFDITFFFFVIVILLAILQGLIIDAFGELRDQLQSVSEKMEKECFICSLGRDVLDKIPRGFEQHTMREHNFANVSRPLDICLLFCSLIYQAFFSRSSICSS